MEKVTCPKCGEDKNIDYVDICYSDVNLNEKTFHQNWKCHCNKCENNFHINVNSDLINTEIEYD